MDMRLFPVVTGLVLLLAQQVPPVAPLAQPSFEAWLEGVRAEALTLGIREATVDAALAGLEPVPTVIQRDRTQAELVQTLDHYLAQRIAKKVVLTAQTMRKTHESLLNEVSEKYGVPPGIMVSIWGLESNFGRFSGVRPTIATLATLAYDPRRSGLFRRELFAALRILDSGDVEPAAMRGSWAGALGQPQFMPSSFLLHAQDFDGDGRRDIWKSTPDVFASIKLAAQVDWMQWSTITDIVVRLPGSGNPPSIFEENWNDSWTFRLGADYALTKAVAIRGGAYHDTPAVYERVIERQYIDSKKFGFSAGTSVRRGAWRVDLAMDLIPPLATRTVPLPMPTTPDYERAKAPGEYKSFLLTFEASVARVF